MRIKTDLLKAYICDFIHERIEDFEIDADSITNTIAIKALSEIQEIISSYEISDFDAVEEIVCVFERYKIDFGVRHDF